MNNQNFKDIFHLSIAEEKRLRSLLAFPWYYYLILIIIWAVGLLMILYNFNYLGRVLFGLLIVVILLILIIPRSKYKKMLFEDLRLKRKKVIRGVISDKRKVEGKTESFFLKLDHLEFGVTEKEWHGLNLDDMVEIHFAPNSKYIFQISKSGGS